MAMIILNFFVHLIIVYQDVFAVNVNDILNVNYLPGTLLLDNVMIDGDSNTNRTSTNNSSGGNWNDAFYTMDFHRYVQFPHYSRYSFSSPTGEKEREENTQLQLS
jgi:hypothetical protein